MTGPEALRLGYKIIREEAGPNILIYGIGGPIGSIGEMSMENA